MHALSRLFSALLIILAIPEVSAHDAKLKIAEVNMTELFNGYYRTAEARKGIEAERKRIRKDNKERLTLIRELNQSITKLRNDLENPGISQSEQERIKSEITWKQAEATALDRERREFFNRSSLALEEKANQRSLGIVEELEEILEAYAESRFNYVFDNSNFWKTKHPELVYSSKSTRITKHLLGHLEKEGVNITREVLKIANDTAT